MEGITPTKFGFSTLLRGIRTLSCRFRFRIIQNNSVYPNSRLGTPIPYISARIPELRLSTFLYSVKYRVSEDIITFGLQTRNKTN